MWLGGNVIHCFIHSIAMIEFTHEIHPQIPVHMLQGIHLGFLVSH